MAKKTINDSTLTAIANAIRAKTGDSDTMTPLEMPEEIASIPTGITPTGTIEITENGTGIDVAQYASADVSVSGGGGDTLNDLILTGAQTSYSNSTVTSIPQYAFNYASYIQDVSFANVETIGQYAFNYSGLKTFSFPKVKTINQRAFEQTKLTGTVTLPATLTTLGQRAFSAVNSNSFTKVVFEGQVPDIPSRCFYGNSYITEYDMTHCTTIPTLANTDAFTNINPNCVIKVPAALEADWKASGNWVTYASHIQGV